MASPIRVLFMLPGLHAGGAERVTITLMNGIDRERFAASMAVLDANGPLRALIDPAIPLDNIGQRLPLALYGLYKIIKTQKPDIVFATMAHMNFAVLLLKPLFPRIRFVVREAIQPSYFRDHRYRSLIQFAYRMLYPRADRVISPARIIQEEFAAYLKIDVRNHALLYNPVDSGKVRSECSESCDRNIVRFVAAGRLHRQKGFDRLLAALPSLQPCHSWHLTILGEGDDRALLEDMILDLGLGDRVTLPGHSDRPWPIYAAADCFLLPSRQEGLPNVVLEALACGTRVIAMREAGGVGEIAALSEPDALTVVETMPEFVQAMAQVTLQKDTAQIPRVSLLPGIFDQSHVIKAFEALLISVASQD